MSLSSELSPILNFPTSKCQVVCVCCASLHDTSVYSLFKVLNLHSPDVKAFLLMDRQNFSDGSEDEDDKVSSQSTNCS